MQKFLTSKWAILPTALIGAIAFTLLIKNRSQPDIIPPSEIAKAVYVIKAPEIDVTPVVKSYGTVMPGQVWRSIAEISGEVKEMHPQLKKGAIIEKGKMILRIDPTDYQLAISNAEANISVNKSQLLELNIQEKNTQSLFKIEKQALILSQNELDRRNLLFNEKSISQTELDREKRTFLNQQKNYETLSNTLALYPVQRNRILAELEKLETQLKTAQRNLERTIVTMPFNGRISEMNIELGQFVRQGELMAIIDGMKTAEISVQIPINRMSQLLRTKKPKHINLQLATKIGNSLGIRAKIRLELNKKIVEWEGRITRISETLDLKTRTIGIIVEVDDPYNDVTLGIRPPLMKGLFVSVELRGRPLKKSIIVPRSSIYNAQIQVVTDDNRLETRTIETELVSRGFAIVVSGLKKGERVIISTLIPAIEGMLLSPVEDIKTQKTLVTIASNKK